MNYLYATLGVLGVIVAFSLYNYFKQKKILKTLTEEEFRAGYRKAQLIDVRETNEYDNGHILGARNIPISQMKTRMKEIRPDLPVYMYCQTGLRSGRVAQMLHRKGYHQLFHLDGGFKKWSGKIKTKK